MSDDIKLVEIGKKRAHIVDEKENGPVVARCTDVGPMS